VKAKIKLVILATMIPLFALPMGCGSPAASTADLDDYPDTPDDQRHERLSIYVAWDGGSGETWDYELSVENVIAESSPPPSVEAEDGVIFVDDELPGGITLWFEGVTPGDVALTFTTKSDAGEVVDIQKYVIRVYDDLRLAILHTESNSFR